MLHINDLVTAVMSCGGPTPSEVLFTARAQPMEDEKLALSWPQTETTTIWRRTAARKRTSASLGLDMSLELARMAIGKLAFRGKLAKSEVSSRRIDEWAKCISSTARK